jgi:tetratricopeptide (TPR) repeat protein
VAATLINMGAVYQSQSEYAKAIGVFEEALEINTKIHGGRNHPDVAATEFNMASVHEKQGNTALAKELCEASLQTVIKTFDPAHHRVKQCQSMLKRLSA